MITDLCIFFRDLRIHNGQLLKHMSELLNTTPSFLSGVETGKNKIPLEWIKILASRYNLNTIKENELLKLAVNEINSTIGENKHEC